MMNIYIYIYIYICVHIYVCISATVPAARCGVLECLMLYCGMVVCFIRAEPPTGTQPSSENRPPNFSSWPSSSPSPSPAAYARDARKVYGFFLLGHAHSRQHFTWQGGHPGM